MKRAYVSTRMDIIKVIITFDSKHAVGIMSNDPDKFTIKEYCIQSQRELFSHDIKGEYIKMSVIE